MKLLNIHKVPLSFWFLLPVLGLAFYIAFIPHQAYIYPVHIDEWVHWAYSDALLDAGSTSFTNPFSGAGTISVSSDLEVGYHLFWGYFQQITGLSWLAIFRFFPSVMLVFTALAVYILGQRKGFGTEAALLTCLIPTTVGILGPAFLVPVSMGIFFVALSLFIAFSFRGVWSYVVLFLFTCFLLVIHSPSAICLVIILVPYILLNLKGNFKHSLGMALAVAVPFLAPFPWIFDMLGPTFQQAFTPQELPGYVDFPRVIHTYGYWPVGLCALGTLALALKRDRESYALPLGLLLILLMLVTFFTFHYGVAIMYERGLMYMMLMTGIVGGAGLMAVRALPVPKLITAKLRLPAAMPRYVLLAVCLAIAGVTLYTTIPDRQGEDYYHMIDRDDYEAFVWIRDNLDDSYERAILDPWLGTPFTAITGKPIYSRIHAYPMDKDAVAREFLADGCEDTDFLREEGISIVYTEMECRNPDLTEVRDNIYVLE